MNLLPETTALQYMTPKTTMATTVMVAFTGMNTPPPKFPIISHAGPDVTIKTTLILVLLHPKDPPSELTLPLTTINKKTIAVEITFVSTTNLHTAMTAIQVTTPLWRHPGIVSRSKLTSTLRLPCTADNIPTALSTRGVGNHS